MRVAIARRQRTAALAEIERKMIARAKALRDTGISDKHALIVALSKDQAFQELTVQEIACEPMYDYFIDEGCIPTIGNPGEPVRWHHPEDVRTGRNIERWRTSR
jgi:hypothetical protein